MSNDYYGKMRYIANALCDIENITARIEFDEDERATFIKIAYAVDSLSLAFSSEYLTEISRILIKAIKKALLKTESILMDELKGELESVLDSLTAEEEYQNGKE